METARAAAAELDRLVPAVHRAAVPGVRELFVEHGRPPYPGVLLELGGLGIAGPVPLDVVRGIQRYQLDGLDSRLAELAAGGWLQVVGDAVVVTSQGVRLLRAAADVEAGVATGFWGDPGETSALASAAVSGAGPSEGPVFPAVTGLATAGLFDRLYALRHHRADAHAAAWQAEGLTADEVRSLPADAPVRQAIEVATDDVASRAYAHLSAETRFALVAALQALGP
jgi:hypothetical protein